MVKKTLMTGNQAVARGFWEAGGRVVASYPGTPSTEITENAVKYGEIHAEWCPNEKVAVEVANGAALGGARAMSCMKHVGVNVAADPLFTASYIGVNGGLVVVSADDPGMHSSQNEQDNRNYARAAKVPALEPADSQECKDFVKAALALSEDFDTPVMLRLTTRIAHSQSLVELADRVDVPVKPYEKNIVKNVMVPANAIRKHPQVEARTEALTAKEVNGKFNVIEWGSDKTMGIVASGAVYQYVREVLPEVSVLKIGMPFPLSEEIVREFAAGVDRLIVIEELDILQRSYANRKVGRGEQNFALICKDAFPFLFCIVKQPLNLFFQFVVSVACITELKICSWVICTNQLIIQFGEDQLKDFLK